MKLVSNGIAALLAAGIFLFPAAEASTLNRFTSYWAFGDSLSDPGNLFLATGGAVPPAPYFEGRFSNGPVWTERLAGDFAAEGLPSGIFAVGQAQTTPRPGRPLAAPPVVDLPGQIALFDAEAAGRLGGRPVASLWFGANDLFFAGVPLATAEAVGTDAARRVADAALALAARGVNDVLLLNLPALDRTPSYALLQPALAEQARLGTLAFNATLAGLVPGLEAAGLNVMPIDMHALFNQLLDDPTAFGVANATLPCFIPPTATTPAVGPCQQPELLAFFDPVHPSAVIHAGIADLARTRVAPVPLPATIVLMLAGLAGLGLVGQRRSA